MFIGKRLCADRRRAALAVVGAVGACALIACSPFAPKQTPYADEAMASAAKQLPLAHVIEGRFEPGAGPAMTMLPATDELRKMTADQAHDSQEAGCALFDKDMLRAHGISPLPPHDSRSHDPRENITFLRMSTAPRCVVDLDVNAREHIAATAKQRQDEIPKLDPQHELGTVSMTIWPAPLSKVQSFYNRYPHLEPDDADVFVGLDVHSPLNVCAALVETPAGTVEISQFVPEFTDSVEFLCHVPSTLLTDMLKSS